MTTNQKKYLLCQQSGCLVGFGGDLYFAYISCGKDSPGYVVSMGNLKKLLGVVMWQVVKSSDEKKVKLPT